MNTVREALTDKYNQYRIPSLEEVVDRIKQFKREFPKVNDWIYAHIEKDMIRCYKDYRRVLIGTSTLGLISAGPPIVIIKQIEYFKQSLEEDFALIRKSLNETSKVPVPEQDYVFNREWSNTHITENKHHTKLKREEEVEVPLVTPIPKEMGTTNPLVRPDATETINPLARK